MPNYRKTARSVREAPLKDPTVVQRASFALEHMAGAKKVLDVGCADGSSARVFKAGGKYVAGIDILPEHLKKASKVCDEVKLVDSSKKIPYENGTFDAIYAGEFIEHLTESDGLRFLKECHRVLRPSGVLVLTTPNPDFVRIKLFRINMISEAHPKIYSVRELEEKLRQSGFRPVARRGLGKMGFLITTRIPLLWLYGDFGVVAKKSSKTD